MKKFLVLALALILVLGMVPVAAVTANGTYGEVPLYKGTITIDGKKDAIWSKALQLKINQSKDAGSKSESSGTLYLLHDDNALYLLFEAKSGYALTEYNQSYENGKAYSTTAAEVNLDWTNKAASNADCKKYICWFDGQYWAYRGNKDIKEVEYKVTVDKAAKTFIMEWKCPYMDGAKSGNDIGLNFIFDSDKTMGKDANATRTIVYLDSTVDDNNGSKFKSVTLSTSKEVKDDAPAAAATTKAATTTTAAKTADMGIISAMAALAASSAAVLSLKKRK